MNAVSIRNLCAIMLMVAACASFPVAGMSCARDVTVVNHRSEPATVSLKWFYGARAERPDISNFREVDLAELQANGLTSLHELELLPNASERVLVRTLCRSVEKSNEYLNWRYPSLDGGFVSGQLDMDVDPFEVHIR